METVVIDESQPKVVEVSQVAIDVIENAPAEVQNQDKNAEKKKSKKRDKGVDQILKSLQIHDNVDDKLSNLCKKYSELLEEHKSLQNTNKLLHKTLNQVVREKDQVQSDYNKAILTKSKLEGLCRELQKQNKFIKEDSLAKAKEDDEKRKGVTAKFQTTINDIQQQMNDHYQKNSSLRDENQELANKLKELCEKYEIREQHIDKVLKTKELETQLYDAKLHQASLQLTEEKELFLKDKQKLLLEAVDTQKRMTMMEEQNGQYKTQLSAYVERYEEFQQTLTKSNQVFNEFKNEMEKMTKKIKKLEKENLTLKQKSETSNKTVLVMAEEKILHDKETSLLHTKIGRLESLCRALQQERNKLSQSLKNGEASSTSAADDQSVTVEKVEDGAKPSVPCSEEVQDKCACPCEDEPKPSVSHAEVQDNCEDEPKPSVSHAEVQDNCEDEPKPSVSHAEVQDNCDCPCEDEPKPSVSHTEVHDKCEDEPKPSVSSSEEVQD